MHHLVVRTSAQFITAPRSLQTNNTAPTLFVSSLLFVCSLCLWPRCSSLAARARAAPLPRSRPRVPRGPKLPEPIRPLPPRKFAQRLMGMAARFTDKKLFCGEILRCAPCFVRGTATCEATRRQGKDLSISDLLSEARRTLVALLFLRRSPRTTTAQGSSQVVHCVISICRLLINS